MKSKMAARGKFKSRNLFCLILLLNVTFPLSSKICNLGIIWSNLASTRANSRGSLKYMIGAGTCDKSHDDLSLRSDTGNSQTCWTIYQGQSLLPCLRRSKGLSTRLHRVSQSHQLVQPLPQVQPPSPQ